MEYKKWNKYGKKYTYLWDRPIYEHSMQKSRVDVKNGIFELYYNAVSHQPINPIATQKKMGKAFKSLFNADKYICVVTKSAQLDNGDYKHNVQFYYKPGTDIPTEEQMAKIEDTIAENTVIAVFKRTTKDRYVKYYDYSELPGTRAEKFRIVQQCNGDSPSSTIQGGKWSYA